MIVRSIRGGPRQSVEFLLIGMAVTLLIAAGIGATLYAYKVQHSRLTHGSVEAVAGQHAANGPVTAR